MTNDHITITSDPYRGVERDGDVVRIRREGVSIPVDVGDLPALIAALEAFEAADVNDEAEISGDVTDHDDLRELSDEAPEDFGLVTRKSDSDPEHACPECGAETHDNLGGRACGECGWSE